MLLVGRNLTRFIFLFLLRLVLDFLFLPFFPMLLRGFEIFFDFKDERIYSFTHRLFSLFIFLSFFWEK